MNTVGIIISICSLITGISAASVIVTKIVTRALNKILMPINKKLEDLDKTQCQNYLIDFLADVERGIDKDETQWEHAHKVYDHYVLELKGNSYVHSKWERVTKSSH